VAGTRKTKVAVLGGGVGGLTAAFELTRPKHEDRFDVTVYQLGWRLGGKGASGRNAERGHRIEEHGLHIWFGFYANAFRLMHDVYDDLARQSDAPPAAIDKAFTACPEIALYDRIDGVWHSVGTRFPHIGDDPWTQCPGRLPTAFEVARRALAWALRALDRLEGVESPPDARQSLEEARLLAAGLAGQEGVALDAARRALAQIVRKAREARDSLLAAWADLLTGARPRLRLIFTTLDAFTAAAAGILADDLLGKGFEAIDRHDWARWLERHGASEHTIGARPAEWAPVVRAVYDVAFSFPGGNIDKADAAAGTATSDLLKLTLGYRGELAYKMTAGMGDVVFAPLYEVLRARDVKFRFFHAVTGLRPAQDGSRVEAIEVVPQVGRDALEYDPLVTVKGLRCWPHVPRWHQLPPAAAPHGTRFETELDPLGRKQHDALTLKSGEDFDAVVLAIPVGALEQIACELMKADRDFCQMVRRSATVRTQAFQLWTRRPPAELGHPHGADSVAATFVEPLDTYCDMEQVLAAECWRPQDGVRGVSYVCGVLDDRDETPAQATERVKRNALEYVGRDIGHLWPALGDDPWPELADADEGQGEARFDAQYWRANTAPWERYVITPSGNPATRLPADRSGFANMVLAGDWTRTPINGGCVEAAVISGMQAARALTGGDETIVGEDPRWLWPR
jgi:uncharacterized protein with NAD-binding domain and iron-sulfur cluster